MHRIFGRFLLALLIYDVLFVNRQMVNNINYNDYEIQGRAKTYVILIAAYNLY